MTEFETYLKSLKRAWKPIDSTSKSKMMVLDTPTGRSITLYDYFGRPFACFIFNKQGELVCLDAN